MEPLPPRYRFGSFEFDPSVQELRRAGERASLPAALNKLLLLLLRRPGQLVTREEIGRALWDEPGTVDVENGINGVVRRLRAQLAAGGVAVRSGKMGEADLYIDTVVGAGYRFIADVETVCDEPVAKTLPVPEVEAVGGDGGGLPFTERRVAARAVEAVPARRRLAWVRMGLAVLMLALVALRGMRRNDGQAADAAGPPLKIDWVPVTYKEVEDELGAQAISPSGKLVATSDRAGMRCNRCMPRTRGCWRRRRVCGSTIWLGLPMKGGCWRRGCRGTS